MGGIQAEGGASSSTMEAGQPVIDGLTNIAKSGATAGETAMDTAEAVGSAGTDLLEGTAAAGGEALAGGLEAAGLALDATGVGAVLGVGLNIAGLAAAGFGAEQLGSTAVEYAKQHFGWFGGEKKTPAPPITQSIAQKGQMITPIMDTAKMVAPVSSAW